MSIDFKKKYDRTEYKEFFRDGLLPDDYTESRDEDITRPHSYSYIKNVVKLGEYKPWDLKVYEIEHESENDPRVSLSKETFKMMISYGVENALVIFTSRNSDNFRLSLVTINLKFEEGTKIVREFSNPRRLSFFLGPDAKPKTPKQFLTGREKPKTFNELLKRFSIEAVTDEFYNEFSPKFDNIAESVKKSSKVNVSEEIAKDFALLFVIRVIFIGFLQKKRWIGGDQEFSQNFWNEYKEKHYGKDQFYDKWLKALFFESLNSPPRALIKYKNPDFSKKTKEALEKAPYLNGGLFQEKTGIDDIGLSISDKHIEEFFNFLFEYNFTIEENTLYDKNLELNPEFLGIIFERLVNKSDGAVYTPRTEVDFMCRISLVKWLEKNNATQIDKKDLYELFFMEIGPGDKLDIDQKYGSFSKRQIDDLLNMIENVTICDPAAGSGAFPVGMLQVIDEVECVLREMKGKEKACISSFDRKKRIIGRSLYGVEVKPWAVWICQLRLWITLFIEASEDMRLSIEPILPSLDFKIGCGDSLVQMVGSKLYPVSEKINLSSGLKRKITELAHDKIDYYDNKKKDKDMISHNEDIIFLEMLEEEISEKEKNIRQYEIREIKYTGALSAELNEPEQNTLPLNALKISELKKQIEELKEERKSLMKNHPLIWSIEFPEIFFEKGGFDIVIGNPPYVRQEKIEDPTGRIVDKKEYKNRLQEMVRLDFPKAFPPKKKINAQSDLYSYFYIRSLRLLNEKGVHTFICSNSWLDVGYGVWLQEFLLDNARVHFIFDNHAKRSFASADVNTIISVIDAPIKKPNQNALAKFVAFKKPFEEVIYTEKLLELENADKIVKTEDFRVFPKSIIELKQEGWDYSDEEDDEDFTESMVAENRQNYGFSIGKYIGQKWGGIFLRAPDIYFKILEKGKGKLVKLGDVADVKFGIKTGCNEFFYLDETMIEKWKIETEFLKPVIKSPKECRSILIDTNDLKFKVFLCNKTKAELKGKNALKYIEWGEKQKTEDGVLWKDVPSVSGRKYWWHIDYQSGNIFWGKEIRERLATYISTNPIAADCRLYYATADLAVRLITNSTFCYFFGEVMKRDLGGGGGPRSLMVYEVYDSLVLDPKILREIDKNKFSDLLKREIKSVFEECGIDPKKEIRDQKPNPLPDRKMLDEIVYNSLDLNQDERNEVYWSVCELVKNRLSKAGSV
ncbi:MAG: hypothetical protein A2452_04325 [Candidatus Firestonebacteria bacterium RIFOXYC2_FULL_39_67]|nr:MAG: hypothetical protein A2536_11220 [Candidatus Firestonebacteria bacterium RIFOXYD2_FULL_39_29]OGF54396.1 MAG: hypothetical protein A2452_04325 [Candidatus Firestonebacteria bacterium RIFOXYC2_FULL_39_67]